MNTNFKVIGLTRLGIKPESTAQETDALYPGPLTGGTFGTGPGIFRGLEILRMPRVKIGIQVCKGNSGLDEGVKRYLDDDAKIMITKYRYHFCNF